jgi:DNA-binding LacI/PurR family transcriptional regulator
MVVCNLANPFFQDLFRALEADAERRGYEVIVANTDHEIPRLEASIRSRQSGGRKTCDTEAAGVRLCTHSHRLYQ